MMTRPTIESETKVAKKDNTPAEIIRAIATENIRRYQNSKHIYTDGSKSERGAGAVAIVDNTVRKSTLPATASILKAELDAINLALSIIEESTSAQHVIFTDSLSAVNGRSRFKMRNHLIERLVKQMHSISERGKIVQIT